MSSEKQVFEGAGVPLRRFALAAAAGFAAVLVCLAMVFGLYMWWVNGPQAPVRPAPLANAAAPVLETELFRESAAIGRPDPKAVGHGYRWRDPGHTRVEIPIGQAMAMTAARGAQAFDPPAGVTAGSGPAR